MAITLRDPVLQAGDIASSRFGESCGLSADGLILVVGAPWRSTTGGVYVYDRDGSTWVQRGSVLTTADADAAAFGHSVAISGDGLVLAVGDIGWDGTDLDQGGVFIFDWSGSAWVQRGSVLVSPAADEWTGEENWFGSAVALNDDGSELIVGEAKWSSVDDYQMGAVHSFDWSGSAWVQRGSTLVSPAPGEDGWFGAAVALSGDGLVLAVGEVSWSYAYAYHGRVRIYDRSGSAWVQRGSTLAPADWDVNDKYGRGLALSDDGARLVVGAPAWDGTNTDAGAAYVFDWSGSAWSETITLEADDAAAGDYFGNAVAVSADGGIIAVGAARRKDGVTFDVGAVYVFADVPPALGTPEAPTELRITSIGTPTADTELTVAHPTGTPVAATELSVTSIGTPTAATALAVIPSGHVARWRARCLIDGSDVSAQLTGLASVTAEEGAARIASITIKPAAGVVTPLDYVGRAIVFDYVLVVNGTDLPRRLFTGRIDTPRYDPNTGLLNLQCVDDLQNRVAALDRDAIDAIIGGRYTAAVQGEIDDNWDYAKALLSTVAGSLDAGPSGGLRLTSWQLPAPWATYDEGDLLYQRMGLTLPQRSTLVNTVSIAFDYRYARLRQRYTAVAWSGTQIDMRPCGWQYPTYQDIIGACNGSGWTVTRAVLYAAPHRIPYPGGGFIVPAEGSVDMAIIHLAQRHAQTVTEGYSITVTAPESVEANGELPHALRGALSSSFDGRAWESALDVAPLMPSGGEQDYAPDADRADSDHAIQTLLDQARVKILGSHRSARVSNAIPCNPDLDLDKWVAVDTATVQSAGKVATVNHVLDLDSGSALTEFSIAISGIGGAGIITPDTLEPPTPPAEAEETQDWIASVPSLFVNTAGVTSYSESLMGLLLNPPETITVEDVPGTGTVVYPNPYYVADTYPVQGFRVRMPGVDDADRNPIEKPVTSSYQIVVPENTLTFTAS